MPPSRAVLPVLVPCLLAASIGCGGRRVADDTAHPIIRDPFAVEVLAERERLTGPRSDRPNRFFDGWAPVTVRGRSAFEASPQGASFRLVTLTPGERSLVLDLLDDGRLGRLVHVRVRIDRGAPRLVPVVDPLSIRLPPDLAPGRHFVEISPRDPDEPTLLVAGARVRRTGGPRRGAEDAGDATLEDGVLLQEGRSVVDVAAHPPEGVDVRAISGELCPAGLLEWGDGVSLEVTGADGGTLARWDGGGLLLDRVRGCRRFELPIADPGKGDDGPPSPVRIRLTAAPGRAVRWRGLSWRGTDETPTERAGTGPPAAGAADRSAPRLVVLYVLDALRADFVGHLGGPEGVSPTIDRLAREGFTFHEHRSNAPNTLPSIRELFTGRIYFNQRAWDEIGMRRPTIADAFRDAGYRTGLFSGNVYTGSGYGLDRGFDHVSREALFEGTPEVNRNAERVHAAALEWLREVPEDEPVFLYVQTIHPHNPYAPPEAFEHRFTAGIPSRIRGDTAVLRGIQKWEVEPTAADRARLRGLYAASLAYNDARLARFLDALEERFDPGEILVAVTSDHGEELFDHGGVLHGYTLYEELLHIPLVVWSPGRVRVGSTDALTDMLDLHATLLDLIGEPGGGSGPDAGAGRSLLPLITGESGELPDEPRFAATWGVPGGIFAVRHGPWKMIRVRGTEERWWMGVGPARTRQREHLFDLEADPGERHDLSGSGNVREQWLRARLRAWVAAREADLLAAIERSAGTPEGADDPSADAETRERLRALGYLD